MTDAPEPTDAAAQPSAEESSEMTATGPTGLYDLPLAATISENGVTRQFARDAQGFTDEAIARMDEISTLERCAKFTDTGEWEGGFSYPGCPQVLLARGWADTDGRITDAGRAALATKDTPS